MNQKVVLILICAVVFTLWPMVSFGQTSATPTVDTPVSGPAAPLQRNNGGQLTASAIVVLAMDWVKKSSWFKWLTVDSASRNRIVALVASFCSAIAVHATFDHAAGVLTITGLTLTGIATGLTAWLKSYVFQQMLFKMSVAQG